MGDKLEKACAGSRGFMFRVRFILRVKRKNEALVYCQLTQWNFPFPRNGG